MSQRAIKRSQSQKEVVICQNLLEKVFLPPKKLVQIEKNALQTLGHVEKLRIASQLLEKYVMPSNATR